MIKDARYNRSEVELIRDPKVVLNRELALEADLQVSLRKIELDSSNARGNSFAVENFVSLIPAYCIASVSLAFSLSIISWDRLPPKERFSPGCNISEVHDSYFEFKRKEALRLITKREQSRRLGSSSTLSGSCKASLWASISAAMTSAFTMTW